MNLVGRLTRHLKFTSQTPGGSILTARSVTLSVFLFAAVLLRGLGELFLFGSYPRTGEYSSTSVWDMYWTLYESRCKVYTV